MHYNELQQVIDHFEEILNAPIVIQNRQVESQQMKDLFNSGSGKVKPLKYLDRHVHKKLKKQLFFQFMICDDNYKFFTEIEEQL